MSNPSKLPVVCAECGRTRYVRAPAPARYVCQRCQTTAAAPVEAAARRPDPWTNDLERRRSVNAQGLERARWLLRHKGWLR